MFTRIRKRIKTDFNAACESIKIPEVEEWFDIYFSRFFGYYLAVLSKKLNLTPNQVSLLSLFAGIIAGYFFYFQEQVGMVLIACFFVTFSGLLDSADGQLARMTDKSSDLGRKIDALIDTLVFVACYTGGGLYFLDSYGFYLFPLGFLAGWCHSVKSAVYEFYKTDFIFYAKKAMDHRIPHIEEVRNTDERGGFWKELFYYLEMQYVGQQAAFISRSYEDRLKFQEWAFGPDRDRFMQLYRRYNHSILTWWALICGTNSHRTLLMITALFGRMDIYFFITIVTFLPMLWVNYAQKQNDKKLVEAMEGATQKAMAN